MRSVLVLALLSAGCSSSLTPSPITERAALVVLVIDDDARNLADVRVSVFNARYELAHETTIPYVGSATVWLALHTPYHIVLSHPEYVTHREPVLLTAAETAYLPRRLHRLK